TSATATSSVVGSPYPITCTQGTLTAANYDFTFVNGQLTINKAHLTVTAENASREYGDANPSFSAGYAGFKKIGTAASSDVTGTPGLTSAATPASSVAGSPYPIIAAVGTLTAANYDFTFVNGQLTINKAHLTVTAENASREYGDANPSFSAGYAGFK